MIAQKLKKDGEERRAEFILKKKKSLRSLSYKEFNDTY